MNARHRCAPLARNSMGRCRYNGRPMKPAGYSPCVAKIRCDIAAKLAATSRRSWRLGPRDVETLRVVSTGAHVWPQARTSGPSFADRAQSARDRAAGRASESIVSSGPAVAPSSGAGAKPSKDPRVARGAGKLVHFQDGQLLLAPRRGEPRRSTGSSLQAKTLVLRVNTRKLKSVGRATNIAARGWGPKRRARPRV